MSPRSLYLAQLAERLGPIALENIGYSSTGVSALSAVTSAKPRGTTPPMVNKDVAALGVNPTPQRPVLTSNNPGFSGAIRAGTRWTETRLPTGRPYTTRSGRRSNLTPEGSFEIHVVDLEEATMQTGRVRAY